MLNFRRDIYFQLIYLKKKKKKHGLPQIVATVYL